MEQNPIGYQRPPSVNRPPTSGVPHGMRTASRNGPAGGVTSSRQVNIVSIPTSSQGLPSAQVHSGQRQVADKNFFLGIIRDGMTNIMNETKRLKQEIEVRKRGQAIQVSLEQQLEELNKIISEKEAELADFNVLQDRVTSAVSVEDLMANYQELQSQNAQHEQEVNRLFRERKDLESIVQEQEKQVQEMMRGTGSPAIQDMNKQLEQLEQECQALRSQTGDLQGKSKEQLLTMMKEYNAKIQEADRTVQDESKSMAYLDQQMKQIEDREAELQTDTGRRYLKLLEKEKGINQFMQNFPQNMNQIQQDISNAQKRIVEGLVQTTRDLESVKEMPTQEGYKEMQTTVDNKLRQMRDAQSTAEVLKIQVEDKKRELADLEHVDKKLYREIDAIKKQMAEMEAEMPAFEKIDAVRADGEVKKRHRTEERDLLQTQVGNIKQSYEVMRNRVDEAAAAVRANEIHIKLQQYESDIRKRAQENYSIQEFIEENRRKTNFSLIKRSAMSLVTELNNNL